METNTSEQARLEQLHRLYYNLQHRILPDIILSEQVDSLLNPNPEGEGLLSEAGTIEPEYIAEQPKAGDEPEKEFTEQEESLNELGSFDFEDEAADFLSDLDQEEFNIADEDLFEEEDTFESEDEDFVDDMFEDDLNNDEDEEEPTAQMLQLLEELNEILELNTVKSIGSNPDENFLDDTWREAWFDTALEHIPERAGYTLKRINQQDYEIVLFTFPEPIQVVDAYMAAAIRKAGQPYRYYTLEATVSEDGDTGVLAEWEVSGMHRNSGSQTTDVRNIDAFLAMIFKDLNYTY